MERFKFPDAVMKNWAVNATELLNCVIEGELSVYDSEDTQVRLRLEEWNGNLYLRGLSLSYFMAHYTISHNLCVFKLSELNIFAKKHGMPSFSHWESDNKLPTEQRNEPKQIGPGETAAEREDVDSQKQPVNKSLLKELRKAGDRLGKAHLTGNEAAEEEARNCRENLLKQYERHNLSEKERALLKFAKEKQKRHPKLSIPDIAKYFIRTDPDIMHDRDGKVKRGYTQGTLEKDLRRLLK